MNKLRWKTQLTQEERSWVWGVIGKRAAQRLSDAALGWFENGQDKFMHEDHLAWKVRAALRAGMWPQVLEATGAMPRAARRDPAWTYWRARALLAPGRNEADRQEATRLLESIASVRGFYEQLALEDLGRPIVVPERPAPLTAEETEAARTHAGLSRALHAIQIGLRSEGVREWNYSISLHDKGGMDDRALLAAADRACQREVWDRCINTSERTRSLIDVEQRFPMPHRDAVVRACDVDQLDPAYRLRPDPPGKPLHHGRPLVRRRFGPDAGDAGHRALDAKKIGLTSFTPNQINDRDTNIAIGTGYLKLVLDDFAGSMPLAAAAYNAGPGRPRSWRNGPILEGAIWAENVPFAETRDYVKKVLSNTTTYAAMLYRTAAVTAGAAGHGRAPAGQCGRRNKDLP
jgi:soluble lytic murein transglycosylase